MYHKRDSMNKRRTPKGRKRDALAILISSLERCIGMVVYLISREGESGLWHVQCLAMLSEKEKSEGRSEKGEMSGWQ